MGQHRYLRVARLPDADQGEFSLSGLDPGGAHCPRPGAVPGPGAALRRAPRHRNPGVAQFLFQVADDGARTLSGTRPVHSVHEAEEHVAALEEGSADHAPWPGVLRLASHSSSSVGARAWTIDLLFS